MKNLIAFAAVSVLVSSNALADDVSSVVNAKGVDQVLSSELTADEALWTINDYVAAQHRDAQRIIVSAAPASRLISEAARSL